MSKEKKLLEESVIRRFGQLANIPSVKTEQFIKENTKTGQIPFDSTDRRPDPRGESRLHEEEEIKEEGKEVKEESKDMKEEGKEVKKEQFNPAQSSQVKPVAQPAIKQEAETEDEEEKDEEETEETPDASGDLEVDEVGDEPAPEMGGDEMGDMGGEVAGLVDDETAKRVVQAVLDALGVQGEVSVGGSAGEEMSTESEMGLDPADSGAPMGGSLPNAEGGQNLYEDRLVEAIAKRVSQRLVKENKNKNLKNTIRERLQKRLAAKRLNEGEEPKGHPVGDGKPFEKSAKKEGVGAPFDKVGKESKGKKEGVGAPFNTKASESTKLRATKSK